MEDFFGLTKNLCVFTGRIVGEPQFVPVGEGEVAFMTLKTYVREPQANGQWVDVEQLVPLMVTDKNKVEVVRKYVKDGKQLQIEAYYKAWEVDGAVQHALSVRSMDLGANKYIPKNE